MWTETDDTPAFGARAAESDEEDAFSLSLDPDVAWERIKSDQRFLPCPVAAYTEKPENSIRVVCISDTHGRHRDVALPPGDILVHAGDFTKTGETGSIKDLNDYFMESGFSEVICIAGNHDITLHEDYYKAKWRRFHRKPFDVAEAKSRMNGCVYLKDESYVTRTGGIQVYGSPWSPIFYDWAFNLERGRPCQEKWNEIPASSDLLIVHGPPLGRGDLAASGVRTGCFDLLQTIQNRVKPRVVVFGHIHEGAGVSFDGTTLFVNASSLNIHYKASNYPIVLDIPADRHAVVQQILPAPKIATAGEFKVWLSDRGHDFLAQRVSESDVSSLALDESLFHEAAFDPLSESLGLYNFGRNAVQNLRLALMRLYAESFPSNTQV